MKICDYYTVYINDDGYERKEMVQENEIDGFIHCLKSFRIRGNLSFMEMENIIWRKEYIFRYG